MHAFDAVDGSSHRHRERLLAVPSGLIEQHDAVVFCARHAAKRSRAIAPLLADPRLVHEPDPDILSTLLGPHRVDLPSDVS